VTANKYGALAASILRIASDQSEECARLALERPLQCCGQWTPLDLIAMAKCDQVGCGGVDRQGAWVQVRGEVELDSAELDSIRFARSVPDRRAMDREKLIARSKCGRTADSLLSLGGM
jgi:hypothetical protein